VRTVGTALPVFGVEPSLRLMRGLGGGFGGMPLNKKRLYRAIENIQWCFPEWDSETVHRHALEGYRHLFSLAAEASIVPRVITEQGYAEYVTISEISKGLRHMLSGRPCLLLTGHCGNWELLGYTLAVLGFPIHALYRPLDMKPLDKWVQETRRRRGLDLVDKFGAASALPALIENGETVAFIADQNAGDGGLFVPFFNRLASAYKTIGLLALRYDLPIVCGHARRLSGIGNGDGVSGGATHDAQVFRYVIDIPEVIEPEDWKDQPDPLFYITARYRRALEGMIRRAPEQYLWMHRAWKSRPVHERKGNPMPARLREKIAALPWITDEDLARIEERSARDARAFA
jgi:KDO2-lipid IV(A) lauroyltransferase